MTKRYHAPETPCDRLLQAEGIPTAAKDKLREIVAELDPLKLLEEMRAVQAYLAALADGEAPPQITSEAPNLAVFVASLSSAWHAGEIRPTFSSEAKPRYLRGLQKIPTQWPMANPVIACNSAMVPAGAGAELQQKPQPIYAPRGSARIHALRMAWPIVYRRLEGAPTINAMQLFEELCIQFPGRFTRAQYRALLRRVNLWRRDARARGVIIGSKTYRRVSDKPRGRRPQVFNEDWEEMVQCLEDHPDQTALELLIEFQARYPGRYSFRQLHALQKRVKGWRQPAIARLIAGEGAFKSHAFPHSYPARASNIRNDASGNRIT